MKKIILILFFASVFLIFAGATTYCSSSVADISITNYAILGIDDVSSSKDCVCYGATEKSSNWVNLYCLEGQMHQSQVRQYQQPPTCQFVNETKYQDIVDDRCKLCEGKEVLGEWQNVECKSDGSVLQKREISVNTINPLTSECEMKDMVEFRNSEENLCKIPIFGEAMFGKLSSASILILLVIIGGLAYIFRGNIKRFIKLK